MKERLQASERPPIDEGAVRRLLEIERSRLDGLIHALEHEGLADESQADAMGELTPVSQHPADVASDTFERERDLGLLNEFRAELEEVSQALIRLGHGTYGVCMDCGDAIVAERLEAVPATRFCVVCEARAERLGRQSNGASARRVGVTRDRLDDFLAHDDDQPDRGDRDLSAEEGAMRLLIDGDGS